MILPLAVSAVVVAPTQIRLPACLRAFTEESLRCRMDGWTDGFDIPLSLHDRTLLRPRPSRFRDGCVCKFQCSRVYVATHTARSTQQQQHTVVGGSLLRWTMYYDSRCVDVQIGLFLLNHSVNYRLIVVKCYYIATTSNCNIIFRGRLLLFPYRQRRISLSRLPHCQDMCEANGGGGKGRGEASST
jgi:hypothetical protein